MNLIQLRTYIEALQAPVTLAHLLDEQGAQMEDVSELCQTGKVAAWMEYAGDGGALACMIAPKRLAKGLS